MAVSCPKCNATIVPGTRACQFCGASVDSIEPDVPESERAESVDGEPATGEAAKDLPVPATPSDAASPVAEVSSPKISGLKKFLLFYVAPPIGIVLVIFIVLRLVSLSSPSGSDDANTSRSPGAAEASSPAGGDGLGVEVYPGARALSSVEIQNSSDSSVVSEAFVTSAPMRGVIDFYKTKMVGYASIYADGDSVVVSFKPSASESVRVSISPVQNGGTTRIAISHTTNKGSK